ncbi:MAG: proline dehydrogenase family protein [Bryobacterales bacterium]|nr:proline dehydrogenase family protein [Bryobacterales bacterium]
MLRTTMLSLSRQPWLRDWMQNSPLASRFTSRFIAGRTLDQALKVCARLRSDGVLTTLDRLGENVTALEEARESRDAYLKALDGIADSQLGSTVSVKLTQMGLDLSERHCQENVTALATRAAQLGTRIEIDMESSEYTDRTLDQVRRVHESTGNVRAVIQAYLLRSSSDVDRLCDAGIPIRLCKGAYHEPPAVAYQQKRDVDASFSQLMQTLLERGVEPAIASHDERLIREAIATAGRLRRAPDSFEFQMLYGIRRDLQRELVASGFRLRVYVPYGDAWYPYFMRRLAERPANLWFVVRNVLRA